MIRAFDPAETDAVIQLWSDCGLIRPWNDPRRDIERKLTTQPELFLVTEDAGAVVATAMIGHDGHRGWVYYLAVASTHRGRRLARELMTEAERRLVELGCPKLMLMVRDDNTEVIDLYEHLGYAVEATRVMGRRLIADL